MPRWLWIVVGVVVIVGGGYFAYTRFFMHPSGPNMGGGLPVNVAEVIERKVQQWQEYSGRLVAVDRAEIRPQVSGLIESIHFDEGQRVKKGDLLFTIDQRPYKTALDAAQARYTLANTELVRAKTLVVQKVVSQREYDQRKNAADVAKAELTRAQLDYDYTLIKAPVSGRVSRAEITVGNLVDASNPPVLTTVVTDQPIYADFDMDEITFLQYLQTIGTDAGKLKDIPVRLTLAGSSGKPCKGRMQSFDNQLDTGTGTIRARAIFKNKDGTLIPGLFVRVQLGHAKDFNAFLVTDRAIGTDQNKKFVLVVGKDNKVEYREVELGGLADGLRIIREGLHPGEKIIVNGTQRAQPGMPVTPEVVPMDPTVQGVAAKAPEPEQSGNGQ